MAKGVVFFLRKKKLVSENVSIVVLMFLVDEANSLFLGYT